MTADEPAAGLIPTLPGRYYIDQGIFSPEQAAIFESLWRYCRSSPGGFAARYFVATGPSSHRRLRASPSMAATHSAGSHT